MQPLSVLTSSYQQNDWHLNPASQQWQDACHLNPASKKHPYSEMKHSFETALNSMGRLSKWIWVHKTDQGRLLQEGMIAGLGTINRSYDALGRVTGLKTDYFSSYIKKFDPMSCVLELERGFDSPEQLTFSYDALGQLLQENIKTDADSPHLETHYQHNSRQQRVSHNQSQYRNNRLGELLEIQEAGTSADTHSAISDSFSYDFDGRLINGRFQGKQLGLSYDALSRLTGVQIDKTKYEYIYDGFDRRIGKRVTYESGEAEESAFIFDDQFEIGSIVKDSWKEFRLVGLRSQAETGDTLMIVVDGKSYATLLDLQGSIVGWVDIDSREIAAQCSYNAFGVQEGSSLDPWDYVSKRQDAETGWVFYGKRYYLPSYGGWLTRDPKGEVDGSNLYAFLRNNPVYHWDLWGHSAQSSSRLSRAWDWFDTGATFFVPFYDFARTFDPASLVPFGAPEV